jgi:PleD family two-component response regulator
MAEITKDGHRVKDQDEIITFGKEKHEPFSKRILIVDDDSDITLTFKSALEKENNNASNNKYFEVYTYLMILY